MKSLRCILVLIGLCLACTATASPLMLTICETENNQTTAWWLSHPELAVYWVEQFARQGIDTVDPAQVQNAPRLSPTVYGQIPLSDNNAKTLASLFGASDVINGTIKWDCQTMDAHTSCRADAKLSLVSGSKKSLPLNYSISAKASDKSEAQKIAAANLVTRMAPVILSRTPETGDIPAIIAKPVVVFDPLPDADTLVALRKRLKRVQGISDVAERWISAGMLAIELNPEEPQMSTEQFNSLIQAFLAIQDELNIHETKRSPNGVVLEVLKY